MVYTWAVELFDTTALIAVQGFCPPAGWYTNLEWGLWPIVEWVGCLASILFLVRTLLLYNHAYMIVGDCYYSLFSYEYLN